VLLEAVRLDPRFASAHAAVAEMYAMEGDLEAAQRHAARAAAEGGGLAKAMLERYVRRQD
jgi:Tfp pilus assembly protein PilF